MLEIGQKPNDFSLPDAFGNTHKLYDYLGKKVIIYFYPKDDTSGCTSQACSFRDHHHEFLDKGVVVIGISKDSIESHKKFVSKYNLPFILLSDETGEVLEQFGVWQEKKMYGRAYMGTVRTTFLLNEDGVIMDVFKKASPTKNALEILKKLD